MPAILEFIQENGNWNKTVKTDVQTVINHYKTTEGVSAIGVFGFCWGGRITLDAVIEIDEIKAGGLVHPSLIKNEEAESVKRPLILLPAKDEPDMVLLIRILLYACLQYILCHCSFHSTKL